MKTTLAVILGLSAALPLLSAPDRPAQVRAERQWQPDQGNGWYRNPILPGNYGDPAVVRVGADYYMIHSGGRTYGFLMWHSRDLVNWRPLGVIPVGALGSPWAPDLVYTHGRFYIYVTQTVYAPNSPRSFANFVYHAKDPQGPWAGPVDLKIPGLIDPGHLTAQDGRRYLYLEKGQVVELTDDGLATKGELRKVYDGWRYPDEWVVECPCLEAPKLFFRQGWYYLVSAMGGTHGPSTSHMAVVARSKSPTGPWEDSPSNPLIRTFSVNEKWWSQGHATLIDTPDGSWWAIYHAIENSRAALGRQTLMLPVIWTEDGWPIIKAGVAPTDLLAKPAGGENVGHGMPISDDFSAGSLDVKWAASHDTLKNFQSGGGRLVVDAQGDSLAKVARLTCAPANHSFEVTVLVEYAEGAEGGLLIGNCGIGLGKNGFVMYNGGTVQPVRAGDLPEWKSPRAWIKVRTLANDIIIYVSADGVTWQKLKRSFRTGSLTPVLYAQGNGQAIFRNFTYCGLD